ncbi:pseudaminic acid synthase [Endozoicomonas sp. SM1973]|uniref:Pseudaminic acid synthase n=1 Tax=Spartinivicinus marinus TaxID=2994442 RepID=A0A853IIZ8_9GAMM|nr:pseudaminic acid synthase [Spartinivicinus marinus]MCX4028803.1 pseudaminic acid synthase [Spartinivicinus marinus]NYZ67616.1 pseudaminic acid synthase [Spartinivicinus marinus]
MLNKHPCICINNRKIGRDYLPYIIAELSANHNGKIENAFKIIDAAKYAGADAVKLQSYTADTITLNCNSEDFIIKGGLWAGQSLYELYQSAHMPWEWHKPLFEYASELGLTIFSSPFDYSAVDLLENLNTPAYKIASFEIVDLPLIRYVANTGKPMIISTGMANIQEIEEAINAAKEGGCEELAILHCVSGYPAPASDYNLTVISDLISRFELVTGLSDHTTANVTAIASIAMGGAMIEKHVTLNRNNGGPDDSFSIEPDELESLCSDTKVAWQSIGKVDYGRKSSEIENMKYRRSLYFVKDLKAGDVITSDAVRSIRPGYGMSPEKIDSLQGKYVKKDIKKGTAVCEEDLK